MVKRDGYIERDSEGRVRFPEDLKLEEHIVEEISEIIYMKTKKDIVVKQLDITFKEHDKSHGIKSRGAGRKWTDEEDEYVLLHHEDGNDEVGDELGRTGMSVFMHRSHLLSKYDEWKNDNPQLIEGKSREEIVKLFIYGETENEI